MPTFTCKYNYHSFSAEAAFDKRYGNTARLIHQALPLIEAISRAFNDALLRLAYTPYPTIEHLLVQTTTQGIFRTGLILSESRQTLRGRREEEEWRVYDDEGRSGAWEARGM